jgi:hypothetical protein
VTASAGWTDLHQWLNEQVWVALLIEQVVTGLSDVLGQGRNSADVDGVTCSTNPTCQAAAGGSKLLQEGLQLCSAKMLPQCIPVGYMHMLQFGLSRAHAQAEPGAGMQAELTGKCRQTHMHACCCEECPPPPAPQAPKLNLAVAWPLCL